MSNITRCDQCSNLLITKDRKQKWGWCKLMQMQKTRNSSACSEFMPRRRKV